MNTIRMFGAWILVATGLVSLPHISLAAYEDYNGSNSVSPKNPGLNWPSFPFHLPGRRPGHVYTDSGQMIPGDGYVWRHPEDSNDWEVVSKNEVIEDMFKSAVLVFKEQALKDWTRKNVKVKICDDPRLQRQPSPWALNGSELMFTDYFLSKSRADRENLVAFEAGKVFYERIKDRPVKEWGSFDAWFSHFASKNEALIEQMRSATHGDRNFVNLGLADIADNRSSFAFIFRVQAFRLPEGQEMPKKWKEVIKGFRTRMDPFLQQE
jgi:hypothetical protein